MSQKFDNSTGFTGPLSASTAEQPGFLAAGGEMAALIRQKDWKNTPLGAVETWPQSLRTAVGIVLSSRYAMFVWWGRDLINLYNDAYRPFLGKKHPEALGQSARDVWSEIWDQIGPRTEAVLMRGESTFDASLLLPMDRYGYLEETYFTFSYSPIRDDNGGVGGIFCAVTEETSRVIGERRLKLLGEVAAATSDAHTPPLVCIAAANCTAGETRDLPFVLLYLTEDDGRRARLVAQAGIDSDHPAAIPLIDLASADAAWPLAKAATLNDVLLVENLGHHFEHLPSGGWDRPPDDAVVMPLSQQGQSGVAGFLVAALNPYLRFDEGYRGFVGLLGGQIAAGIANARAYEEERKRAEALAEVDRAKTAFFSNVSHEFRTPLTLMLGPIEDALNDRLSDVQRERLEVAYRNSLRLLRLVNTLLDFSRIEAGRIQAAYAPTDLAALTSGIASSFRSAIERAGLTFEVDCPPLPRPVYVARDMWEKVLLNLLSNAFKFTFAGEISVTLRTSDDHAILAVRDTGVGIPPNELPRVFDRFHRIEGQRSRTFEGSGIGLALVQELVKLHGGVIGVKSAPGAGTEFAVSIPFGSAHLPQAQIVAARETSGSLSDVSMFIDEALRWLPDRDVAAPSPPETDVGERPTVLVADDNADMRDYVTRLLARRYEVVGVADGVAALEAIRERRPDLVLSDVMMPGVDGFGLIRAIRVDSSLRDMPIILLSARAGEEARIVGLEAGADDYLIKPFAARELLARVGSNLTLARLRREVTQAALDSEKRLRDVNEALEARVALRTVELQDTIRQLQAEVEERERTEEALRQAQKMEAVGQLTGGIAHDFNNLLTVIIGGLERIERFAPRDDERVRRAGELAMQGARRAAMLTQRLLAFSRRQPLDPQPTDVNRMVNETSALLHRTLGETVELEGVLAPRLWAVDVDRGQLENALINLAVNARDAMPDGGKLTIETSNTYIDEAYVATAPELKIGQYVAISVSDTGTGMPPDILEHVFEPFFTTKEAGRGTGLGLSQVYGFIKQSGGHVRIYSEPKQGTTVRLYLPRYRGEIATELAAAASGPSPRANGETILVVEDDDHVRAHTTEVLRELGYRILEARDANAALRIIQSEARIDLLFTDVVLPGGYSGRQLAEMLIARRPGLKVLYTTGYARNAIVHQGRLDPGTALITKPFAMNDLAAKVWAVLNA